MERDIRYDQRYQTLLVVHRYGNYTVAGNELALTPSAVTQQVHSIERELNISLFRREGKKLFPTKECDIIVEYVKKIQSLCTRLDHEIDSSLRETRRMVFGVTPSVADYALSTMLDRYISGKEDVQITIRSGSSAELSELLCNREIDLAIAEGDFPGSGFSSVVLDTDYLVVAVPCDSPYVKKRMITLRELQTVPLILRSPGSGTRTLFEAHLKKSGLSLSKFHVMMEVDSVDTIKKLVGNHYGLSILSYKACAKDVAAGQIATVPLCDTNMIRQIHIFYRDDFRYNSLLRDLQQNYEEAMRDIAAEGYRESEQDHTKQEGNNT